MTNSFPPARKTPRRTIGQRAFPGTGRTSHSAVGDRLRDAREARGVDIYRVERDTKIRAKFITALEDGEFADLPGDVYTRGFIRNYATYLGLNPDEIEEEWRSEAGGAKIERPQAIGGPKPMSISRGFVFQRSHLAIVGVVLIVALVGVYFGFQVTRFLSYPTVGITSPSSASIIVPPGTTSYKLSGAATAGSTVLISWDSQDPKTTVADTTGHWTYDAVLHPGKNRFDITAKNLDTSHASKTESIIIQVLLVTPPPPAPVVAFTSPADLSGMKTANISVSGTADMVTTVTLRPVYLGPPPIAGAKLTASTPEPAVATTPVPTLGPAGSSGPSATPTDAPPGPGLVTMPVAADGTFTFTINLTPGTWRLELGGYNTTGGKAPVIARTISIPYHGINVTITVRGGSAAVYISVDGNKVTDRNRDPGWSYTAIGGQTVCVSSNHQSRYVYISVNGRSYGSVASFGGTRVRINSNLIPRIDTVGC